MTTERITVGELSALAEGKRVLGVNPPVHDFAFFDLWSKPMGLLFLLGKLRGEGADVSLLDMVAEAALKDKKFGRSKTFSVEIEKPEPYRKIPRRFRRYGISEERAKKRLAEERPDIVLVSSAMTYWYLGVKNTIDIVKKVLPNAQTVLGGVYVRLCTEHASGLGADFIMTEHWHPDCPPAADLYGKLPYGVVITSFGCPFACEYCASRELWHGFERRPLGDVERETEDQYALGARDFAFYDDALLLDKEGLFYPLCKFFRKTYGGSVRLHTPNGLHVREIDGRCAEELYGTGFKTIRLSLESIDERIAPLSSFKAARDDYISAVKHLNRAGYSQREIETYILLGLPGQSAESVKETINFVKNAGGAPKLAEFSPIPGTPAFEKAAERIPELRREPLLQNNTVYSTWVSGSVPPEVLQELRDLARL